MLLFKLNNLLVGDFDFSLLVVFIFIGLLRFVRDVALVRQHEHADIVAAVFFDLFEPAVNIHKRFSIGEIEYYKNTVGTFVVGFGDSAVPLLAGGVPDLEPDRALIDLESSEPKINSNRGDVVFFKVIVGKSY